MVERSPKPVDDPHPAYQLRLYIAGNAPNSIRARANLATICREYLNGNVGLEVIDVWQDPQRALADGVFATPMLKRIAPNPEVTVFGDLGEITRVAMALGVGG